MAHRPFRFEISSVRSPLDDALPTNVTFADLFDRVAVAVTVNDKQIYLDAYKLLYDLLSIVGNWTSPWRSVGTMANYYDGPDEIFVSRSEGGCTVARKSRWDPDLPDLDGAVIVFESAGDELLWILIDFASELDRALRSLGFRSVSDHLQTLSVPTLRQW
jgi:hypothetical protein